MSNDWRWCIPPINGSCEQCKKPLRQDAGAGIVEYSTKRYHTHCLLDHLTEKIRLNTVSPLYHFTSLGLSSD